MRSSPRAKYHEAFLQGQSQQLGRHVLVGEPERVQVIPAREDQLDVVALGDRTQLDQAFEQIDATAGHVLLPAGKQIMARQDWIELQFAARPAFGVMRDSRTALDPEAVEAALHRLRHAHFEVVDDAVGSRVPQRPDPERNGQAFLSGRVRRLSVVRRPRAGRRNRRAEECSESDVDCLAASETDGPLLVIFHVDAPSWSRDEWLDGSLFM